MATVAASGKRRLTGAGINRYNPACILSTALAFFILKRPSTQ
jgi:hypothetical protein